MWDLRCTDPLRSLWETHPLHAVRLSKSTVQKSAQKE